MYHDSPFEHCVHIPNYTSLQCRQAGVLNAKKLFMFDHKSKKTAEEYAFENCRIRTRCVVISICISREKSLLEGSQSQALTKTLIPCITWGTQPFFLESFSFSRSSDLYRNWQRNPMR